MELLISNPDFANSALNSISEGVLVQDSDGRIVSFNNSVLRILGVSADELTGKSSFDLSWVVTKSDGTPFPESERPAAVTRKTKKPVIGCVMRVLVPGRTMRWLSVSSDVFQKSQYDYFVVVTFVDVTDLRAEHEFTELVIKTSPILKIATDLSGNITLFNPAAERSFDYLAQVVVGKMNVSELFESTEMELFKKSDTATSYSVLDNSGHCRDKHPKLGKYEALGIRKDGSRFPVEVSIVQMRDNGINTKGYLYNAIDITERKAAAEMLQRTIKELERSNLELEGFAYVASHDLQAPLRHISSYVDLLQRKLEIKVDSEAGCWMKYIVDGTETMKDLLEGLLTYSRVSGSQRDSDRVDLNKVLGEISTMLQTRNPDATFEFQNLPTVIGNYDQLHRLFQNLMQNAVKFCRPGFAPQMQVTFSEKEDEFYFEVKDNGIGIEREHFDRVFQLFQRLHTKEKYEGSGIGLSVCQKIVDLHGGRIWVESIPGIGSTFCFTLKKSKGVTNHESY